jgi:hypothetical protein
MLEDDHSSFGLVHKERSITVFWIKNMGGEIFNAAILPFVLVLVGIGLGYLLLKLTPEEE